MSDIGTLGIVVGLVVIVSMAVTPTLVELNRRPLDLRGPTMTPRPASTAG